MGSNHNHPKKGASIKVEPIRSKEDIAKIKAMLANKPRDLTLFTIGINTNLRASDLAAITISQARQAVETGELFLKEIKTGKHRHITVNNTVRQNMKNLLATSEPIRSDTTQKDDAPLFQSRKNGYNLTVPYINNMVKEWCRKIRLKGNYGSHSLRKTFGYIQRTEFNTPLPVLMKMFNHSYPHETMAYLCIQPEEIREAYMNEI